MNDYDDEDFDDDEDLGEAHPDDGDENFEDLDEYGDDGFDDKIDAHVNENEDEELLLNKYS